MTFAKALFATIILAASLFAQQPTKPTTTQLKPDPLAQSSSVYTIAPDGSLKFVKLGPSLRIVCTPACTIEVVPIAPATPSIPARVIEKLVVSSVKVSEYTLANTPTVGELDVQRNGIELTEGFDYDVSSTSAVTKVVFRPGAEPLQGDSLRFKYR